MPLKHKKRPVDDPLWKSVLEQVFPHFLRFFFTEAEKIFDFTRKFIYLDKEMQAMFPPQPRNKGVRYVDKLVRVPVLEGEEKYVLIHVEAQSTKSKEDLAERMFEYYVKIFLKYRVPVTAIVILADEDAGYRPAIYKQEFMGTELRYKFNSYKILDQEEAKLKADPNPFSVVALTALLSLHYRKADDEELLSLKHELYDQMMLRHMDREARRGIYDFLAYYVQFEKPEMLRTFEEQIRQKQGRSTTVGTREYLLDKAKREGIEQGIQRGIEQGITQGHEQGKREAFTEIALNLLKQGVSVDIISKSTGLSKDQIEKLRFN